MCNTFFWFPIPWVNAEFVISFCYDHTFWLHMIWSAIMCVALDSIFRLKHAIVGAFLFDLGYEIAKGTCSQQGMNLLDLLASIIALVIFTEIYVRLRYGKQDIKTI